MKNTTNNFKLFISATLAFSLVGCGSMPKTPDMLVENAKSGAMVSEKDVFEVNKPIEQVSEVLKKKSHECFEQEISFASYGGSTGGIKTYRRESRELTSKMHAGKQRTRLTLQVKNTGGSTELGGPPPDGWYFLVVDAYPEGKSKTRVEAYYQHTMFHSAFTAIKPWVTGTDMKCPDLTE